MRKELGPPARPVGHRPDKPAALRLGKQAIPALGGKLPLQKRMHGRFSSRVLGATGVGTVGDERCLLKRAGDRSSASARLWWE
jgi:hypothetical protein